jgi:hypothetical protein
MAYEVFSRTNFRVDTPAVSIVPAGRIVLNSAATRTLASKGIRFVLLLWDSSSHKMALRASPKANKDCYAVSLGGHSGSVRAKAFFTHIGWNAPRRETLPAVWNENDKMFEVMLPPGFLKPAEASEKPRKIHKI